MVKIESVEKTTRRRASKRRAFVVRILGPNDIIFPILRCLRDGVPDDHVLTFQFGRMENTEDTYLCLATVWTRSEADNLAASVAGIADVAADVQLHR
jgi:hypothetical protein